MKTGLTSQLGAVVNFSEKEKIVIILEMVPRRYCKSISIVMYIKTQLKKSEYFVCAKL